MVVLVLSGFQQSLFKSLHVHHPTAEEPNCLFLGYASVDGDSPPTLSVGAIIQQRACSQSMQYPGGYPTVYRHDRLPSILVTAGCPLGRCLTEDMHVSFEICHIV